MEQNRKSLVGKVLTTDVKRAMLQALSRGYLDEYSSKVLIEFFSTSENCVEIEIVDHRLLTKGVVSDEEFERIVEQVRAERQKL